VIVPYAAGGPNDTVARIITQKLSERWGQSFFIENIPAGAGNVGTTLAAKAAPDGYTVVIVTSSFFINPGLYAKIQYDPIKDFSPLTMVASAPHVLAVHPSFPARDVIEFVGEVKANPSKYSYASAGVGQSSHLAGELFKLSFGLDLVHVPFNGAAPQSSLPSAGTLLSASFPCLAPRPASTKASCAGSPSRAANAPRGSPTSRRWRKPDSQIRSPFSCKAFCFPQERPKRSSINGTARWSASPRCRRSGIAY
jgi:hypothetical protein